MNRFLKFTVAALVAVFFSSNTFADNQGISIGVWASQNDVDTYGSEKEINVANSGANDEASKSLSEN